MKTFRLLKTNKKTVEHSFETARELYDWALAKRYTKGDVELFENEALVKTGLIYDIYCWASKRLEVEREGAQ